MAGVEQRLAVQSGDCELLAKEAGARLLDRNLRWLGEVRYSEEEQAFARTLQASAGVPQLGMDSAISPLEGQPNEGGSTDVGDVSYRAYVPDGPPPLPKPE